MSITKPLRKTFYGQINTMQLKRKKIKMHVKIVTGRVQKDNSFHLNNTKRQEAFILDTLI